MAYMTDSQYVDELKEYLQKIPVSSALVEYLQYLHATFSNKNPLWESTYEKIVREEKNFEGGGALPFLSVIMRTQGKRPEPFREALLCLAGQEDQDFEIIIIGHKVAENQKKLLDEIIKEQPDFLREKIRYFSLDSGTRTTPLNFGFAHARGEYIAVLDDDDIVFDNWVSSFHKSRKKNNNGLLLHSGAFSQAWHVVDTEIGIKALRAQGSPDNTYTREFNLFFQLKDNRCPITTIAFPAYLFHNLGIIFDESLTTTEDWDYIMRCAFIAGVEETGESTFLYRRWLNEENSQTIHNMEEWNKNRSAILKKFDNAPLLVGKEARKSLSNEIKRIKTAASRIPHIDRASLYLDRGTGFQQKEFITANFREKQEGFEVDFYISEGKDSHIRRVRFDPGEQGLFCLKKLTVRIRYMDGSEEVRGLQGVDSNGYATREGIFFLNRDPWIIFDDIKNPLRSVTVSGYLSDEFQGLLIHMEAAEKECKELRKQADAWHAEYETIINSRSWKLLGRLKHILGRT